MPAVSELAVPKRVLEELRRASEEAAHEVAALLFGKFQGTRAVVSRAELLELDERSSAHFVAKPEHIYKLYLDADVRSEELVAIFHSHPTSPVPSERDLEFMKLNPVAWLIYSTITGEWGAYQLAAGSLRKLELKAV